MSKTARQADISFDPEDPRCNDGGPACEGCLMVGWCIGDYPPAVATGSGKDRRSEPTQPALPVYRAPLSMGDGWFENTLAISESRQAPEVLRGVPEGFGLLVGVDWLSPMALLGDILWVHPGRPARNGARVLVRAGKRLAIGLLHAGARGQTVTAAGSIVPIDGDALVQVIVAIEVV